MILLDNSISLTLKETIPSWIDQNWPELIFGSTTFGMIYFDGVKTLDLLALRKGVQWRAKL